MAEPQYVKVWLPGEWPWAEVVTIESETAFWGKLVSPTVASMTEEQRSDLAAAMFAAGICEPFPSLHDHKQGDVLRFELRDDGTGERFMVTPQESVQ